MELPEKRSKAILISHEITKIDNLLSIFSLWNKISFDMLMLDRCKSEKDLLRIFSNSVSRSVPSTFLKSKVLHRSFYWFYRKYIYISMQSIFGGKRQRTLSVSLCFC